MTISVDYWKIEIDDTIASIGAVTIIEQCGLYNVLCEKVFRNPANGNLWQGTRAFVIDTTLNLGTNVWEGVDLAFNWATEALGGTFTTNMIGTWMLTKETTPLPADSTSTYDCVGVISTRCFPSPKWRHTASLQYDSNEWWSITTRWRYFGGVDYDGSRSLIAQDNFEDGESYIDLSARFIFMENHDVVVGINNIFDREPPIGLSTNGNTIAGFYDTLGRYLFAQATFRF